MKWKVVLLCFTSLPFLLSCHPQRINSRQIEEIVFYPMPKGIERSCAIYSFLELSRYTRDTCITDRKVIKQFASLLNNLELAEGFLYSDLRCAAIIKLKSGDKQCFCFGYSSGILHNDCSYLKDSPEVFEFIDSIVYATKPSDYWYDDKTRALIRWVNESGL